MRDRHLEELRASLGARRRRAIALTVLLDHGSYLKVLDADRVVTEPVLERGDRVPAERGARVVVVHAPEDGRKRAGLLGELPPEVVWRGVSELEQSALERAVGDVGKLVADESRLAPAAGATTDRSALRRRGRSRLP